MNSFYDKNRGGKLLERLQILCRPKNNEQGAANLDISAEQVGLSYSDSEGVAARLLQCLFDPTGTGSQSVKAWWFWLAVSILPVLLIIYLTGPIPTTVFPEDTLHLLDFANRLAQGLRPYVDFNTSYGPLSFLPIAWGVHIYGVSMRAIWFAQLLVTAALGILTFYVASKRLSMFWTVLLSLKSSLLVCAASPIAEMVWREFGHAMWYNDLSFVLFGVLAISVTIPNRSEHLPSRVVDSLIDGVLLGALFLTKISFFVPAVVLYGWAKLLWPRRGVERLDAAWCCVSGLLLVGIVLGVSGASLPAYLDRISGVASGASVPIYLLPFRYIQHTTPLYLFGVGLFLFTGVAFLRGDRSWSAVRMAVTCLLGMGLWMGVTATCAQHQHVLPFLGVFLLTAAAHVARETQGRFETSQLSWVAATLIALLMLTTSVKDSLLSRAFVLRPPPSRTASLLDNNSGDSGTWPQEFVEVLSKHPEVLDLYSYFSSDKQLVQTLSGLAVLEKTTVAPGDTLFTIPENHVDCVTMFTDCRYGRHAETWWHQEVEGRLPSLRYSKLFEDVDWILQSRRNQVLWEALQRLRSDYIADEFIVVAESRRWVLYGRRNKQATTP